MATSFLRFCRAGSVDGMAFAVGVSGVECAASEGRIYTGSVEGASGSGILVAWAVALGSNFVGNGLRLGFWCSSSFPLLSSVNNDGQKSMQMSENLDNPSENSAAVSISSSCSCCLQCSSTVMSTKHSSSG